ncbi:MAG: TetR/AcrR family transcriptional regulator [Gammaproteobacteria bacterium]
MRERKLREGKSMDVDEAILANMLICFVDGKINQFVRTKFERKPTHQFGEHWSAIKNHYFTN